MFARKYIVGTILFLQCAAVPLVGQSKADLRFFPFQPGNQWQFKNNKTGQIDDIRVIDSTTVNIDSTAIIVHMRRLAMMSNGWHTSKETYWIDWFSQIYDVDYSPATPVFDLMAPPDTSWLWGDGEITVGTPTTKNIFGIPTEVRSFIYSDTANIITHHISYLGRDFGFVGFAAELGYSWDFTGCIINGKQFGVITNIYEMEPIPTTTELLQNYPNPFNPATIIPFRLSAPANVRITVTDIVGRSVREFMPGVLAEGAHTVALDAAALPSGIYFATLTAGNFRATRKMLLLR